MYVCVFMYVCVYVCVWLMMTCTGRDLDLRPLHLRNLENSKNHLCLHLHPHGGPGFEPEKSDNEQVK